MNLLKSMAVLLAAHAFHDESPPRFETVEARLLPEPWASMLDHDRSMTAALAECYGDRITLRLIGDDILLPDKVLDRAVILGAEALGKPVALAGLRIYLDRFSPSVRVRFVEALEPFGGILKQMGLAFSSEPVQFVKCAATPLMAGWLDVPEGAELFGRLNAIYAPDRTQLAQVLELLAPPPNPADTPLAI